MKNRKILTNCKIKKVKMLFQPYIRDFNEHRPRRLSAYEFFDQSSWKIAEFMREYLNNIGQCVEEDKEFINMFRSKNDKQHYSAIFELLTYTVLKNFGFEIEKHPDIGTLKKPDFRTVTSGKELQLFLECTLAGNSFENLTDKNRKETVEEIIEGLDYFPYYVNLSFRSISDRAISKKKLINFIEEVKQKSEGISNEELFQRKHLYQDDDWKIEISLLRKPDTSHKRSLGFVSGNAKTIDTSKPILNALNGKKPSRYGISSSPYVICLNTNDLFTKEHCFSEALFGQYDYNKIDLNFDYKNGLFIANKQPNNTSISAVIIFRNFDAFTLDNSQIAIWHNPYAKNPVPLNLMPFTEYIYEKNLNYLERKIIEKEGNIFTLLQIDEIKYKELKSMRD
jgi:hypothetical protein